MTVLWPHELLLGHPSGAPKLYFGSSGPPNGFKMGCKIEVQISKKQIFSGIVPTLSSTHYLLCSKHIRKPRNLKNPPIIALILREKVDSMSMDSPRSTFCHLECLWEQLLATTGHLGSRFLAPILLRMGPSLDRHFG